MEPILGFRHEAFTIEAVRSAETALGRLIAGFSADLAADVAAIIEGTFHRTALRQLVSSQLDVDRMDYLLRDSMMTGVKYGVYDIEWVLRSLEIDTAGDRIYVSAPGIYAVEDYLQARYYMYRQVYFHRTLRAAEAVLQALVRRALALVTSGTGVAVAAAPMEKVLRGEKLVLADHLELDDTDIIFSIKQWRSSPDPVLSDLAKRFIDRRLFKAFDLDMPENERASFLEQARIEVADAGFDPDYYFVEDTGGDAPHYFYSPASASAKDRIFVEDGFARPAIREISEVSAAVRGLQNAYRIHRVCFPAELSPAIGKLYHGASPGGHRGAGA
jgi:HD superfamily phosphohydrolase